MAFASRAPRLGRTPLDSVVTREAGRERIRHKPAHSVTRCPLFAAKEEHSGSLRGAILGQLRRFGPAAETRASSGSAPRHSYAASPAYCRVRHRARVAPHAFRHATIEAARNQCKEDDEATRVRLEGRTRATLKRPEGIHEKSALVSLFPNGKTGATRVNYHAGY
ncbi:hypothetical protein MRX96_019497 [Rhipicephalus microplus]